MRFHSTGMNTKEKDKWDSRSGFTIEQQVLSPLVQGAAATHTAPTHKIVSTKHLPMARPVGTQTRPSSHPEDKLQRRVVKHSATNISSRRAQQLHRWEKAPGCSTGGTRDASSQQTRLLRAGEGTSSTNTNTSLCNKNCQHVWQVHHNAEMFSLEQVS